MSARFRVRVHRLAMNLAAIATPIVLSASLAAAATTELLIGPAGEADGDALGPVAHAGDVNGDGFDDVIAGAPENDAAGTDAGRAYVYYGGPDADDVADLVFTGQAAGDEFGAAVAGAGDVNGDGYDDVIVGAPFQAAGGVNAGRAYVYYGGPSPDTTADLTLTGEAVGDNFGEAVAGAGDVNGDGYADVIAGARFHNEIDPDRGRAYVYFGGPAADAVADLTVTGATTGDQLGCSVAGAGDLNGDGFDDILVGARLASQVSDDRGYAYVYYGGTAPDAVYDLRLSGEGAGDYFGTSVAGVGDVNADGYSDVMVGAPENDTAGAGAGRAYVFYGGPSLDTDADVTFTGEATLDFFGTVVSGAGDVNGDGFDDVIVGSFNDAVATSSGRAYVFFGGPAADSVADLVFSGDSGFDLFGQFVGGGGDVNGDGFAEILIGADGEDWGGSGAGRAYVYSSFPYRVTSPNGGERWVAGRPATVRWRGVDPADLEISVDGGFTYALLAGGVGGDRDNEVTVIAPASPTGAARVRLKFQGAPATRANSDASDHVFRIDEPAGAVACRLDLSFIGEVPGERFGGAVADAGDVNGDGFDDYLVGAERNDTAGTDAGRAYLYFGGPAADALADLTFTGEGAGDNLGYAVAGAGDMNGDGFDDFVIGAYQNDGGGSDAGRAYVHFGGVAVDNVADLTLTGAAAGDFLGISVADAGDVNADGFADLLVAAYGSDVGGSNAGQVYLYFGGIAPDAVADATFTGEAANDLFGSSVDGAGDVNGDGHDDIVVGAFANDAGGSAAGRAYVFHGGPSPDAVADLTFTGEATLDGLGTSVAGAGDVNGDGYDDVIVGANGNDAGGGNAGRAYVYLGGPSADDTADLVFTGDAIGDNLGRSVAGAGDVNGDGFADVIVGAYSSDGGGLNAGRAYIYHGGPAADAVADRTLTGAVAGDQFGFSVARAGDGNGDGLGDVLVGANLGAGTAFVYECGRYFVTSPAGGDTWNVGATEHVRWLGAEPADVSLSVDGGSDFVMLATSVGGSAVNTLPLVVPHLPSRFARVRVTPSNAAVTGSGVSDSLFTIDASIALLSFRAMPRDGGAVVTWETDPAPEDLAAYRLERAEGGGAWRMLVETLDTEYVDGDAQGGATYRLTAVNGLGGAYLLGETTLGLPSPLAAWPTPYRGGELRVSFATLGGLGGSAGPAEVVLYDVTGRAVRTIARGDFLAGTHQAVWDGLDAAGRAVSSGVYFLQVRAAGNLRTQKLVVVR